jgi:hypothetical protein
MDREVWELRNYHRAWEMSEERRRGVGNVRDDRVWQSVTGRGEDLTSMYVLHPHCRNQVSLISECWKDRAGRQAEQSQKIIDDSV